MARALECPACGARHRLDTLPESPTFRCQQCGQVLKVPSAVSSDPSAPPPPSRTGALAPVAPPPRRANPDAPPSDQPTRVAPAASAAAVSATVSATADHDAVESGRNGRGSAPAAQPAPAKRSRVAWYWRLLAWVVAVPLGFFLTAWPAYQLGFIEKDDLLDIFVGTGIGRYLRLGIVTFVWALVTALLVQLFVEGGRVRAARRRRARAATA
jgi:hypothetical protein